MRISLVFLLASLCSVCLWGQKEYTYIADYQVFKQEDLFGYSMIPAEVHNPKEDERPTKIALGEFKFLFLPGYLHVFQGEAKTSYNLNSIFPEKYGFKGELMNARNSMEQGHIKVILNPKNQIEALILKKAPKQPEIVYYMSVTPKNIELRDNKYFTNQDSILLPELDSSFYGKKIVPFFSVSKTKQRLYPKDSLCFWLTKRSFVKGKKKITEQYLNFKWTELNKEEVEEVKEQAFLVTKISLVQQKIGGRLDYAYLLESKDLPNGMAYFVLGNKKQLKAIEFDDASYILRSTLNIPKSDQNKEDTE